MAYSANHSKEVTDSALKMIDAGATDATIAKQLGVSIQTVHGWKSWRSRKMRLANELLGVEIETAEKHLAMLKEVIAPIVRKSDGIAGIAGMGKAGGDMSELGRDLLSLIKRLMAVNSETAHLLHSIAL